MKRLLALGGLGALIAALGVFAAVALAADKLEGQKGEHQVVVCKYVGTPGVNERLQTGGNPIVVDYHSIPGFDGTFPFSFADAQGNSKAVQWTDDVHFSDLSVCPTPPEPSKGELIVVKHLVTDDGTAAHESDFSFTVNGRGPFAFESDGSNSFVVPAGDYVVAEVDPGPAWTVSGGGTATVVAGHSVTVTITNDDVKGEEHEKGALVVTKVLVTDDGAVAHESDFSFTVNGRGPFAFESDGSNSYPVPAGHYNVVEVNPGAGWTVTGGGTVEVEAGETTVVTITNNDVKAPPPHVCPDGKPPTPGEGAFDPNDDCKRPPTPPATETTPTETTPTHTTDTTPTTPTTAVPAAPFTPPKASTKPAAPKKVVKATTPAAKPTVKVAGAVAENPPKLAYTP